MLYYKFKHILFEYRRNLLLFYFSSRKYISFICFLNTSNANYFESVTLKLFLKKNLLIIMKTKESANKTFPGILQWIWHLLLEKDHNVTRLEKNQRIHIDSMWKSHTFIDKLYARIHFKSFQFLIKYILQCAVLYRMISMQPQNCRLALTWLRLYFLSVVQ